MYLVIAGNINPKEIIDFLNKNCQTLPSKCLPQIKQVFEPETVVKEKEYIQTEIKGKLIQIAYKEKIQNLENLSFDYAMMKIYLSKKLSVLSNLKDITEKDNNYIAPYVYYSLDVMDGYYVIQNYVKVKEEKDAASILTADLQNKKITRDDFELLKKYQIISLLKKLD